MLPCGVSIVVFLHCVVMLHWYTSKPQCLVLPQQEPVCLKFYTAVQVDERLINVERRRWIV